MRTVWDATRAVECYERLKAKGPMGAAVFPLLGSPFVYALLERATHDQIPLLAVGVGRTDASDGRVFPHSRTPVNWWSQNIQDPFIGQRLAAWRLKAQIIVHVHHDSDLGRETIPLP